MPCDRCKGVGHRTPDEYVCPWCDGTGMSPAEFQEFKEQTEALSIAALTPWPSKDAA